MSQPSANDAQQTPKAEDAGQRTGTTTLQLREVDELMHRFILSVSNEMRNPLASLEWNLTMLVDQLGASAPQARYYVATAQQSIVRLSRIASELTEFVRAQRGGTADLPRMTPLYDSITQVIAILRPALDSKSLTLSLDLPERIRRVQYDGDSLNIIFRNLLANSAKFSTPGGRIWLIGMRNADDKTLAVIVNDNASPIPAEKQRTIFDDFRQLENYLTRRPEGMGLGLAVARHVARALGGDITLEARADGNSFKVTLPVEA